MKIEQLVDCRTTLGEGPLWDTQQERIYWIDSFGNKVYRATARGTEIETWDVPDKIGSIALRKDGNGAIVALRTGLHLLDFASGRVEPLMDPEADIETTRLNDGKVDRRGRFVVGSMDMQEEAPNGALYRLDPDFTCHRLTDGIMVSNGPCWSPDGTTFYFTDTWSEDIWAYDYDLESGTISNRRTLCSTKGQDGVPDGSTVDAEGFIWNAQVYGGYIVRYAPDGTVDRRIEMPVKKVTSVMFGGPELDILYVTSMAKPPLPHLPEDGPLGGSLFAIRDLGIRGIPEPRFAA
ncbi:SMP-30/gluconolactonase/LRE family protein [Aquisalimonas lutea]|uniref:SMP-30/gluconolactonase/LRE family protein n=1 Tax=Aquisalimonas lutea TaxID=1327750 RepID=UPI0025B45ECF|nr:SMP-30/gluconolactonase/LRE family protein [Aquisalimonas lutea]MDN3516572.1 SMP-30/gluconolactonase/LRE family protein [Aquisalimonas lutea]